MNWKRFGLVMMVAGCLIGWEQGAYFRWHLFAQSDTELWADLFTLGFWAVGFACFIGSERR